MKTTNQTLWVACEITSCLSAEQNGAKTEGPDTSHANSITHLTLTALTLDLVT